MLDLHAFSEPTLLTDNLILNGLMNKIAHLVQDQIHTTEFSLARKEL